MPLLPQTSSLTAYFKVSARATACSSLVEAGWDCLRQQTQGSAVSAAFKWVCPENDPSRLNLGGITRLTPGYVETGRAAGCPGAEAPVAAAAALSSRQTQACEPEVGAVDLQQMLKQATFSCRKKW
jgi:hypothetical protein